LIAIFKLNLGVIKKTFKINLLCLACQAVLQPRGTPAYPEETPPFRAGSRGVLFNLEKPGPLGRVRNIWLCRKIEKVNSKFKARNPKQYQMTKIRNIRNKAMVSSS
jgi:hypothetical protein